MTEIRDVAEFRPPGARNFIRVGDWVRVDPPIGRAFLAMDDDERRLLDRDDV